MEERDQGEQRLVPRTPRARRARLLIGVAITALAVSGFLYLRPAASAHSTPVSTPPPPEPRLTSVQWASAQNGWVVLEDAAVSRSTLLRTQDGGRHWQRLRSTDNGFLQVSFVDSRFGVLQVRRDSMSVNATTQQVFLTRDGGSHWLPMPVPQSFNLPARAEFVDPRHGWLMTDPPIQSFDLASPPPPPDFELWQTVDGGQHWRLMVQTDSGHAVSHGILERDIKLSVSFADPLVGWLEALGPDGSFTLYGTRDGGQSWAPVALPAPPAGWTGQPAMASPPRISGDGRGALVVTDIARVSGTASTATGEWVLSSRDGGET